MHKFYVYFISITKLYLIKTIETRWTFSFCMGKWEQGFHMPTNSIRELILLYFKNNNSLFFVYSSTFRLCYILWGYVSIWKFFKMFFAGWNFFLDTGSFLFYAKLFARFFGEFFLYLNLAPLDLARIEFLTSQAGIFSDPEMAMIHS